MQTITARMADTLTTSHAILTTVDVLYSGVVTASLDVVRGQITADKTAAVRSRITCTLAGSSTDLAALNVVGAELRVRSGVKYPDGTTELVAQGVFRVEEMSTRTLNGRTVADVNGLDRSAAVQDARFTVPTSLPSGTNYATAIGTLLGGALPAGTSVTLPSTTYTTPALQWDEEGDRWGAAVDMATSCGWRLVFDPSGNVVGSADLDPATAAVSWTFVDGSSGVTIERTKRVSRSNPKVYNGAIVIGMTSAGVPVRGTAFDTDGSSPTRWGGPFGTVPIFERSNYVTTQPQADAAALALLTRKKRSVVRYTVQCAPLPHLEDGDVVIVDGLRCVIMSRSFPLTADRMVLEVSQ